MEQKKSTYKILYIISIYLIIIERLIQVDMFIPKHCYSFTSTTINSLNISYQLGKI